MPEAILTVRRLRDLSPEDRRRRLRRSADAIFSDEARAYARRVIADVAREGDAAVVAYTARWDGVVLAPAALAVGPSEIADAHNTIDASLRVALDAAIARVRRYNEWLRPSEMTRIELEPGITVGVRWQPVRSAGLYVPSGKGTFPSTMIMLGAPAVVAGVEQIAVVACLAMAALLAWRLPPGPRRLSAIRPALALTLAWLLVWPLQRPWYDAIAFCLLAVFPATRLDWVMLIRAVPAALAVATGAGGGGRGHPAWLAQLASFIGNTLSPDVRLAAALAVVLLCVTAAWGLSRPPPGLPLSVRVPGRS